MKDGPELVLHVWPGRWDLPTFTPACLASVLYLQLTMPGKFIIQECVNPDSSPDGQLPFITHGLVCIASFPSIVKFVERIHKRTETSEVDEELAKEDGTASVSPSINHIKRAQETAWMVYVSAHLGDLVACSLFTLRHNYYEFVRPALAELFPVPQRYYVPDRLRQTYRPRLEAAGLWSVHAEEEEEEKRQKKGVLASNSVVHEAFGKAKVLEQARMVLDILSRLLGDKPFFLESREPSALDAFIAAHILLLTTPPFPNELLRSLISESYPSLLTHARKLHARTLFSNESHELAASLSSSFDFVESQTQPVENSAPLRIRPASPATFSEAISALAVPFSWRNALSGRKDGGTKSKKEKQFDRMRWAWYGLAALGIVGWVWSMGLQIQIVMPQDSEGDDQFEKVGGDHEIEEESEEVEEDEEE